MNLDYLTPDEAKEAFENWMKEQAKDMVNPDNARYQIVITKESNGRNILSGLML